MSNRSEFNISETVYSKTTGQAKDWKTYEKDRKGYEKASSKPIGSQSALSGTSVTYATGQAVFREGDDARYLYRVVTGGIRLSKVNREGRRQVLRFVLRDGVLGLEHGEMHELTAEALCGTEVLRYRQADINTQCREHFDTFRLIVSLAKADLAEMQGHVIMLASKSARERVAHFLLRAFRNWNFNGGNAILLPMSRLDIADYLGLSVETVCREFSALRRKKIIASPTRQEVVIKDIWALRAVAAGEKS